MTNTIRWYDRDWAPKAALGIGSLSLAGGIHFDGHVYWLTDQTGATGSVGGYILDSGAFTNTAGWVLPTGYSLPTGITGDGQHLYVACTHTDAGPPVSVTRTIIMFTKRGEFLKDFRYGGPTSVAIIDLDYNGQNLLRALTGVAAGEVFEYFEPTVVGSANVYQSPDLRPPQAMTFDGMNYPSVVTVAGLPFGTTYDQVGNALQTIVALGSIAAFGCCFVQSQEQALHLGEWFQGEAIAVAYRS